MLLLVVNGLGGGVYVFDNPNNTDYFVVTADTAKITPYFNNNNMFCIKSSGGTRIVKWYYNSNGDYLGNNNDLYLSSGQTYNYGISSEYYLYSDRVIKNENNVVIEPVSPIVNPYIQTSTESIESWNFDYFTIISNIDISNATDFQLNLTYGDFFDMDVTNYLTYDSSVDNTWVISIPRSKLFNEVIFNDEGNYLIFRLLINGVGTYDLGSFTLNLTTSQIANINAQKNSNQLENIQSNINNSNINSDYSSGFSGFSNGMNITDNTSIDSIFNMIYNSFTTKYGWSSAPVHR